MDPIQSKTSSSSSSSLFIPSHTECVTLALKHLQEHKHEIASLSEKEFSLLQSYEEASNLFQEVFGISQKECSYDQILKLRLDAWAKLSQNNQRAKEKILAFLQNSSQNSLNLSGSYLTSLPDIWQHSSFTTRLQMLNLSNNELTSLPSSIGDLSKLCKLFLSNNGLTSLPSSIGNLSKLQILYVSDNELTFLPESISQLSVNCLIDIERCPFSQRVLQELSNTFECQGPRITYSHHESSSSSKSTKELLQELFQIAQKEPREFPELETNTHLHNWLSRLADMADYKTGGNHRKHLAYTVLDLLETANSDPMFRVVFFAVIEEATKTCGDRMALSLLHLGIQYKIATMPKDDPTKVATLLIRGPMILDLLEKIAQKKVASMKFVDPIEVYLAYPVRLQQELKIPIDVKEMLYFSGVKEEEFIAAKETVEKVLENKDALYQDLIQREAWIDTLNDMYPQDIEQLKNARNSKEAVLQAGKEFLEGLGLLSKKALDGWKP